MSAAGKSPVRPLVVGGVAGLIIGCLIGWLVIGWWIWPVKYEGDAYTYELNDAEKIQYVAAVADSYNLNRQLAIAQQRFSAWTTEEKASALAQLFAEYQVQGRMQEAQQVAALASELQRVEGWDPSQVSQALNDVVQEYYAQGESDRAQAVSLFASSLEASAVGAPSVTVPVTPSAAQSSSPFNTSSLLAVCGVLLLAVGLVALALIITRQRPVRRKVVEREPEAEWVGEGPQPLLQKTSSYALGMDNFDESFAIETGDGEWLGECGMGISETIGEGTPRRVAAFEVWLFDKPNTRTVTTVLMSDYAHSNEVLRNKLSARGDPVLATPGGTFSLETPDLTVDARIVEMEYGEGEPAYGYFKNLNVMLTAYHKSETGANSEMV